MQARQGGQGAKPMLGAPVAKDTVTAVHQQIQDELSSVLGVLWELKMRVDGPMVQGTEEAPRGSTGGCLATAMEIRSTVRRVREMVEDVLQSV